MKRIILSLALAGAFTAPLAAKEKQPVFVETYPVMDKPVIAFEPEKAYILLRSEVQVPLYFMKVPSAEDQKVYDKLRANALIEAHGKYVKKLASWTRDKEAAAKSPGLTVGEKPDEPTEQNFEFTQFGMLASVGIGPMNRFYKKGISTYLQVVTPGTYRVYGFLSAAPGAAPIGSCFCMGSVKFEAKAGEIVDLGVVGKAEPVQRREGDSSYPMVSVPAKLFAPAGADMPLDPRLASFKITPVKFKPTGKLPNYFGLTILRIPEIPGVMKYDRDRIIDLTAGK